MALWLTDVAAWLDAAGLKEWAGGHRYAWINTLHLLGLVMLIGGIGVVDLRLAGIWPKLPTEELSRALTPVAVAGLVLMFGTGALLFAADGRSLSGSTVFRLKLVLIVLALCNAVVFRALFSTPAPIGIVPRAMAATSLGLWLAAGACGRLIAYT